MKKALYVILICIALGLIYVRFRYSSPSEVVSSSSPVPSSTPISKAQPGKILSNEYFSLNYPEVATTSTSTTPDAREWVISYMGEEQKKSGRTQTELWGYAVAITRFEAIGDNPDRVQAEADRQGIVDACSAEDATTITTGMLGEYSALTFFGGCLGEADYYYLKVADTLYRLTVMVVGSDDYKPGYQTTVSALLDTLRFK